MSVTIDYVSILAGGACTGGCPWCIGRLTRQNIPSHFAPRWREWLGRIEAPELSISGSTSDPLLCPDWREVFEAAIAARAQGRIKRVSFHTRMSGRALMEAGDLAPLLDELCLTVLPGDDEIVFHQIRGIYGASLRVSSVVTKANKEAFESLEFFKRFPSCRYTLRLNVFEPGLSLQLPGGVRNTYNIHGQEYWSVSLAPGAWAHLVIWDFPSANKQINARYLWPDGQEREQCFWDLLHEDGR